MTPHPRPDTLPAGPGLVAYRHVQAMIDAVPDFAALHAAVDLDVFEILAHQSMTSDELADVCGTDPAAMDRLAGWLHAHGFITDTPAGYRLTELGHVLTADADPSQRHAVLVTGSAYWWDTIGHLTDTIRRGHPTPPNDRPVYEHLAHTPELAADFDRFMTARSTAVGHDLAAMDDWTDIRLVADLGGGQGGVLATLLHTHPHLRGILAERPHVAERARTHLAGQGLLHRVQITTADIFEQIPQGAQRYLLSSILHNYSDEACVSLLTTVRQALQDTADGEVWIVEGMLPTLPGIASPWHSTDIRMMALFHGGRVRRSPHLYQLAEQAGLSIHHTQPLPNGQTLLAGHPAHERQS